MFNDIMNPEGVKTKTYISDITLAYFLDTHWYADVDLTKSEKSLVKKISFIKFIIFLFILNTKIYIIKWG